MKLIGFTLLNNLKDRFCILFFCHSHSALCNVYTVALDRTRRQILLISLWLWLWQKNKIHAPSFSHSFCIRLNNYGELENAMSTENVISQFNYKSSVISLWLMSKNCQGVWQDCIFLSWNDKTFISCIKHEEVCISICHKWFDYNTSPINIQLFQVVAWA